MGMNTYYCTHLFGYVPDVIGAFPVGWKKTKKKKKKRVGVPDVID